MTKRHFISLLCCVALILGFLPNRAKAADTLNADILATLGLIQGTGSGYALTSQPTRVQAAVLLVRLSGAENEARQKHLSHPFTDVPAWASDYVGYAYQAGLVKGTSATRFGSSQSITAGQYAAMLLRLLGYDENADLSAEAALQTAVRLGFAADTTGTFTRGDLFDMTCSALTICVSGSSERLIDRLVASGAVAQSAANAVGFGQNARLTARQVADRFNSAVFFLSSYQSLEPDEDGVINPSNTASGFFISADGLAVTNYHSIKSAVQAIVTLSDGSEYFVDRVLYFDAEIDVAVLRVSQTSVSGEVCTAFPYLTMQSAETVHNGDIVYAIGSPLGLQNSISSGIVGCATRTVEGFTLPMIQNTAAISTGSSGGALFNEYGCVIGITSAYFLYGQSLYLAVPIDAVLNADLNAAGQTLAEVAAWQATVDEAADAA
jgi:S1-C subfamily serine protease